LKYCELGQKIHQNPFYVLEANCSSQKRSRSFPPKKIF